MRIVALILSIISVVLSVTAVIYDFKYYNRFRKLSGKDKHDRGKIE